MGNTPSLPGLGGGRTHGMRYHDPDSSWRGRRPEGIPAENMETELIEVLEPSVSHNWASLLCGGSCTILTSTVFD